MCMFVHSYVFIYVHLYMCLHVPFCLPVCCIRLYMYMCDRRCLCACLPADLRTNFRFESEQPSKVQWAPLVATSLGRLPLAALNPFIRKQQYYG